MFVDMGILVTHANLYLKYRNFNCSFIHFHYPEGPVGNNVPFFEKCHKNKNNEILNNQIEKNILCF